ncbi:FkbM family methyltransferase [bacterium]|jgi:hypothetical protein|nr:FkbM family methyltransferase [bacterium]
MKIHVHRRLKILFKYLLHYKKYSPYVNLSEILRVLFEPKLKTRASRHIKYIKQGEGDHFLVVQLKNIENVLYWPVQFPIKDLYQVISECFNEDDWHYYEASNTPIETTDVVADCGASEGIFSLKHYKNCKFIYIIEPLEIFCKALKKTFKNADNIKILNCALNDGSSDEVSINSNSISSAIGKNASNRIKATTIDNIFYKEDKPVNYIKIDVEGSELEVLRGGINTIRSNKPRMSIAVYHNLNDWKTILGFVKGINTDYKYKVKGICHLNFKPVLLHLW